MLAAAPLFAVVTAGPLAGFMRLVSQVAALVRYGERLVTVVVLAHRPRPGASVLMRRCTVGQPTKLTPEVQTTLVRAIGLGATLKAAAQAAGVSYGTIWEWQQKANAGKRPYTELFEALSKAEGERQMRWLAHIEKAATDGLWTAAAWKLERLYPDSYALKSKLDVTVNVEEMDDDTLDAFIAAADTPQRRIGGARAKAS